MLDGSAAQSLLITAPAGFGKTSLACEWLEGRDDVAWFRTTPACADLAAFSVGIAQAMGHLVPGAADKLRQRLLAGEPPEFAARPMAELLTKELADWPPGARLVIDDYNLLFDSAPVQEFMDWLLTLAAGLRLVVTSRQRPPWASARRFLQSEVLEVTGRELAMTDAEARKVLEGRAPDTVRQIISQANGWPALIGLASLSTGDDIPEDHVSERLYRYFAEEVYRLQRPELRRFMLVASVPSTASAELARDVIGATDAELLIEDLLDQGLLQPISPSESVFHPLLRAFLRRKLELDAPQQFASLADAVASHARTNRRWEEAIDLAMHRRQLTVAAEILAEASNDLLPAGQIETLEKWLEACGPAASTLPGLLVKAELLFRHGQVAESHGVALDLARRLDDDSEYLSRAWCLAGQTASFLSQPEASLELHLAAVENARNPDEEASALWGCVLACVELESDDVESYLERFERVTPDTTDSRLRIANARALLDRGRGNLAGTWNSLRSLMPLVDYAHDPKATSFFLTYASYVAMLSGDYQSGRNLASRAERICSESGLDFAVGPCLVARAYAETGLRDYRASRNTIAEIRRAHRSTEDPELLAVCAVLQARLAVCGGDRELALERLRRAEKLTAIRGTRGELVAYRSLIQAGLGLAAESQRSAVEARRTSACAEVHYLARFAEAAARLGPQEDVDTSSSEIGSLFREALANGVADTFIFAYRTCPSLLSLCAQDHDLHDDLARLCGNAGDDGLARSLGVIALNDDAQDAVDVLSPRERQVFELLSGGLSNAEIAKALFIAESTVKVHTRKIFTKLGVRSRLAAALLARDERHLSGHAPQ